MKLNVDKYTINIYTKEENNTLVIMHEDHNEGAEVFKLLDENITLATISNINWEDDLSPWPMDALFKKAKPFKGEADRYLNILENKIVPSIIDETNCQYEKIYIAGYSLAGLFSLYASIKLDRFDGFVCASGSLWYKDIVKYVNENKVSSKIKKAYFSIGNKEAKTKNIIMQKVEDNSREIENIIHMQDVKTTFVLNEGGHFNDDSLRLTNGIKWIINN